MDTINDTSTQCDRRSMLRRVGLAAGLGGAAALVGPVFAGESAQAADGQSLVIGASNSGTNTTHLVATATTALHVEVGPPSGYIAIPAAVSGRSVNTSGLAGVSGSATGVTGSSEAEIGVHGTAGAPAGGDGVAGVMGDCVGGPGVHGRSYGCGVVGQTYTPSGLSRPAEGGVVGDSGVGAGVTGLSKSVGVYGHATTSTGIGVRATGTEGAAALVVTGVARFSRSGVASIVAGAARVTVHNVALTSFSFALSTLQGNVAGNAVRSVAIAPSSSSLTIYLLHPVTVTTKVAWFVLH